MCVPFVQVGRGLVRIGAGGRGLPSPLCVTAPARPSAAPAAQPRCVVLRA